MPGTNAPSGPQSCEAQLQGLNLVSATLVDVLDAQALPAALVAALRNALPPAEAGLLWLHEPQTGAFRATAATPDDLTKLPGVALSADDVFLGLPPDRRGASVLLMPETVAAGAAILRPADRSALTVALGDDWPADDVLILPLWVGDRMLGVVWLLAAHGKPGFSPEVVPLSGWLAHLAPLALDRAQREAAATVAAPKTSPDQSRSEALATLSHELRTPLATIKGYATALLLEEAAWSAEEQREFLTLIDRDCDTLQAMIGEVLDSALIDAGHLGIEPEPVRLPHLAHQVADEVQRQTTNHRLVDDFPADFPLLTADPRRLRQVLRNILDNAVKYSPAGGLIVIRGEVRPADVVISIADQGVGIAPEDLIPLSDKYFRVKSAAGSHVPGTGLGLPVTRAIVEAHGGRIWAESKLGRGTTFYFSLPRDDRALLESA